MTSKRLVPGVAALAALSLAALTTGAPSASAASGPNCGSYPAGQFYTMRTSQVPLTSISSVGTKLTVIKHGASVTLGVRLLRNGEQCSGKTVRFYAHGRYDFDANGNPTYHLSRTLVTDSTGLIHTTYTNRQSDFRWFGDFRINPTINHAVSNASGAKSTGQDLVQVRG